MPCASSANFCPVGIGNSFDIDVDETVTFDPVSSRGLDHASRPAPIGPFDDKRGRRDEDECRDGRRLLLVGIDAENGEYGEACYERQPYDCGVCSRLFENPK